MASRRAVALATNCINIYKISQPRHQLPLLRSTRRTPTSIATPFLPSVRLKHTRPSSQPASPSPSSTEPPSAPTGISSASAPKDQPAQQPTTTNPPPQYELTFTCVPCGTRSTHKVSKQGYHHGSVLIACPGCKNRHVISDHLQIFGDRRVTVEDLMRERGRLVKKGTLGEDGDVEFWDDGTVTQRDVLGAEAAATASAPAPAGTEETGESWRNQAPGSSFKKPAAADGTARGQGAES